MSLKAACSAAPSALDVSVTPSNMPGRLVSRSLMSSLLSPTFTSKPSGSGRNTSKVSVRQSTVVVDVT